MATHVPTTEDILRKIQMDYPGAMRDSRQLLSLFADYSRGQMKPQQNQLDIFLKCDGNTCILKVSSATQREQQPEYAQLIRRMVSNYGIQETVALDICGAFWRVVHNTPVPSNQPCESVTQQQSGCIARSDFNVLIEVPEFEIDQSWDEPSLRHYHGKARHVVIPDGVIRIDDACFANQDIESVTISNSVRSIGKLAFYSCRRLKTVSFPESLQRIGMEAFRDCVELETVILPKCLEQIEGSAFAGCTKLKNIHFSESLKYVGGKTFDGCMELETVIFPESLEEFGLEPFPYVSHLKKIVLPGKIEEIYTDQLGCGDVTYVRVSPGTEFVFYANFKTYIRYLEIPDTVRLFMASSPEKLLYPFKTTILASDKWLQEHQNIFQEYSYLMPPSALDRSKYYKNGQWTVI